jgi:hypothetical protein
MLVNSCYFRVCQERTELLVLRLFSFYANIWGISKNSQNIISTEFYNSPSKIIGTFISRVSA